MRIAKNEIPERINVPGAIARQVQEFGDTSGFGKFAGEYFSLAAGTDIALCSRDSKGTCANLPIGDT